MQKLKKILTILYLGILFFFVLELCARTEDWLRFNAPFFGNYSSENLYVFDELGKHGRPHGHFEKWKLNSYGFRGPEISKSKPPEVFRVAFMGASETFGLYESPDMEFPAQFQAIMNQKLPGKVEFLNSAVPGMSLPMATYFFENHLQYFDLDLVILYPSYAFYLDIEAPEARTASSNKTAKSSSFQFRIKSKINREIKKHLPLLVQDQIRKFQINKIRNAHEEDWGWSTLPNERTELFERQLVDLLEACKQSGTQIILATHATRFQETLTEEEQYHMTSWVKFYPQATGHVILDMEKKFNEILKNTAHEHGVYVVDVDAHLSGDPENFADFSHFNDLGAEKVAQLFADFLYNHITSSSF